MGMYTELVMACEIKASTPTAVTDLIKAMCNGDEVSSDNIPDDPLFQTDRWAAMLRMDSAYFSGNTHSECTWNEYGECYNLTVRCNLKNYDGEIEKFVDWLRPYIYGPDGAYLGYKRYEEDEKTTLIYK